MSTAGGTPTERTERRRTHTTSRETLLTKRSPPDPAVSASLTIRGVTLRNRVVGAPMERNYCDLLGRPTDRYVDYLEARARGGAALLFTESSYVAQSGKARRHQMGIHDDLVIDSLRQVAHGIHRHGAFLGVELNHGGRVVPSTVSQMSPVGPSAIPCAEIGGEVPHPLSSRDIDTLVDAFHDAAARAIRAGADVVSIHAAHGYLIGQFLSPRSNRREDEYAAPTRFLNRVVRAVREGAGGSVPLFLRLSAFEGLPGGLDTEASLALVDDMDLDEIDVIDLSAGTYGAGHWITPSGEVEEGYLAGTAKRYKERTGKLVCVAGRIVSPEAASELVADGTTDLVAAARALHADPTWSSHVLSGTAPRPCISCNQGCADVIFSGLPLWCAVNPATGHEGDDRRVRLIPGNGTRHVVAVVGGGPAGLEAATTLARAGVGVQLLEAADHIGGQLRHVAALRAKPQFGRLLTWYADQLAELDVDLRCGSPVRVADLESRVSAVVVATGGADYLPSVAGMRSDRVRGIRAWLAAGEPRPSSVTIWGADRAAVYLADDLSGNGVDVTMVASQHGLAEDAGVRERMPAVERLMANSDVHLHLGSSMEAILDTEIVLRHGADRATVASEGLLLVSQGVIPGGDAGARQGRAPVVVAGEAAGQTPLDRATASGRSAAHQVLAGLAMQRPRTAGVSR